MIKCKNQTYLASELGTCKNEEKKYINEYMGTITKNLEQDVIAKCHAP